MTHRILAFALAAVLAVPCAGCGTTPQEPSSDETASAPQPVETIYPNWTSHAIYTAGDIVIYQGCYFKALWWTRGNEPKKDVERDESVSYTHLDVYKRQLLPVLRGRLNAIQALQKGKKVRIGDHAVFDHLRHAVAQNPLRQGGKAIRICQHQLRLIKSAHQIFALGQVNGCLLYTSRCV